MARSRKFCAFGELHGTAVRPIDARETLGLFAAALVCSLVHKSVGKKSLQLCYNSRVINPWITSGDSTKWDYALRFSLKFTTRNSFSSGLYELLSWQIYPVLGKSHLYQIRPLTRFARLEGGGTKVAFAKWHPWSRVRWFFESLWGIHTYFATFICEAKQEFGFRMLFTKQNSADPR